MNIFTQFFKGTMSKEERNKEIQKDLMRREADLNKTLFGPVPQGAVRDFFCLDKNTWIWYEEWVDQYGQTQKTTTRYVVRPTEIVKSRNGGPYSKLELKEAINFEKATTQYAQRVKEDLYATEPSK